MFHFYDCLLKFLYSFLFEVKFAFVVFRHSVGVTENKFTLAFNSQQSYFLLTGEASFFVFLEFFRLFFFGCFFFLDGWLDLLNFGNFRSNFDFYLFLPFSKLVVFLLVAGWAEPVGVLGAVEGVTLLAKCGFWGLSSWFLCVHKNSLNII